MMRGSGFSFATFETVRNGARREGADKALFYVACALNSMDMPEPREGESPAEWMGRWRAMCEMHVHLVGEKIARGDLNLRPLPKPQRRL